MPPMPPTSMATPKLPQIIARSNLGKNRSEAVEMIGSHHVCGAVRYTSRITIARPTPRRVMPNKIRNIHLFTPNPGVSQRSDPWRLPPRRCHQFLWELSAIQSHHSSLYYARQRAAVRSDFNIHCCRIMSKPSGSSQIPMKIIPVMRVILKLGNRYHPFYQV